MIARMLCGNHLNTHVFVQLRWLVSSKPYTQNFDLSKLILKTGQPRPEYLRGTDLELELPR